MSYSRPYPGMASSTLDTDVEADCGVESSEMDLDFQQTGFGMDAMASAIPRQPTQNLHSQNFGVVLREPVNRKYQASSNSSSFTAHQWPGSKAFTPHLSQPVCNTPDARLSGSYIQATRDICDDMIEDGAHVVFDWDNTLKLYNKETQQLSCRVSKQFLLHLKHDRHCKLYIISAIRPSALNLDTLLLEVDRLGLTDVFTSGVWDYVDGTPADKAVVKPEYAYKGNVIICGYDKAETFLKLSRFNSARGDKVSFFDDEEWNIDNFSVLVPNSRCYLCK